MVTVTSARTQRERVSRKLERINRDTEWYALTEREFSEVMLGMEDATAGFYEGGGEFSQDDAAIQEFWAREWGCTYNWLKREWRHTSSGKRFESEGEKRAKLAWVERKAEEEAQAQAQAEAEAAALQQQQEQQAQQAQQQLGYAYGYGMEWVSEYDDAYGTNYNYDCEYDGWCELSDADERHADERHADEAYAHAAATVATAPSTGPALTSGQDLEVDDARAEASAEARAEARAREPLPVVRCQGVLYLEELADGVVGGTDWRIFIYYDDRTRRYVVRGSRRTPRRTRPKTVYPDTLLSFRRKSEVLDYLGWCMNVRPVCNVVMYAMNRDALLDPAFTVDRMVRMTPYGQKTELYGYDGLGVRSRDLADQLYILRSIDWTHSSFDDVRTYV
jgi:hypothetical protein